MTTAKMTYPAYVAECKRLYGRGLEYRAACRKADNRNMAGR